ncbi:MAG: hypothetical protein RIS99_398, partial [Bacteroidota bacterium]
MKKVLYTLLFLFFGLIYLSSSGQTSEIRYGGVKLGLNMGGGWQQSDVQQVYPMFSRGLTLGIPVYSKPNAFWAVDLRGRWMNARSEGNQTFRTSATNSDVFKQTPQFGLAYGPNDSLFYNHRTIFKEGNLELVLGLNRLREKTGVYLYGFGGLGIAGYQVFNELIKDNGSGYNFSSISVNQKDPYQIADQIRNLQKDGNLFNLDYESAAIGYDLNTYRLSFTPSLGAGLGFYLTPGWLIGLEHKVSYPWKEDRLDGYASTDIRAKYDRFHYTALKTEFTIGGRLNRKNRGDKGNQVQNDMEPSVRWEFPVGNPYESASSVVTVRA